MCSSMCSQGFRLSLPPSSWGGSSFHHEDRKTFFPQNFLFLRKNQWAHQQQTVSGLFTSVCLRQTVTPNKEVTQIRNVPISAKSLSILGHSRFDLWAESISSWKPSCSLVDGHRAQPVTTAAEAATETWPNSRRLWVIPVSRSHSIRLLLPGTHKQRLSGKLSQECEQRQVALPKGATPH